jgi:phenylacetate-coenzyme A ligase PaaK-like adenylate-forming protein
MLGFNYNKIFDSTNLTFEQQAIAIFKFQYAHNPIYQQYVNAINCNTNVVTKIEEIPFLPIQFFKNYDIKTTEFQSEIIFTSSGTTGTNSSKHLIKELNIYKKSFTKAFNHFYGDIDQYCIIGLLPAYLEREGSSLIYMVDDLIQASHHPLSDFYLYEHEQLYLILQELEKDKQPTILFGVTFALLDFAAKFKMNLKHVTIIETGGMKGRGKEYTRTEVHEMLKTQLGVTVVHSEYGMTELLSQAYSKGNGLFTCPPWMKILARQEDDPFFVSTKGKGGLNVIDLANVYSCSFIATDDLVNIHTDHSFEVLGRFDNSDVRGCSLLTI